MLSRCGLRRALLVGLFCMALGLLTLSIVLDRLVAGISVPSLDLDTSAQVLDRHGHLLRAFTVDGGRWRLAAELERLDPLFVDILLRFEDRRFYQHHGVDPRALLRAGLQLLANGRIVSGGSTITMQLARLLTDGSTRSLAGKWQQSLMALALERRYDKRRILTAYLTLAPYGGNIEGLRAAALTWLGKEPERLTPAQAALLVALPQAPETRRPDRHAEAARRARDRVLARAEEAGIIAADEAQTARHMPVPTRRRAFPVLAAHTAERLVLSEPRQRLYRLTIDRGLQQRLEALATERAAVIDGDVSVSLLVADHRNGAIRALVGSADPFDERRSGYIDMSRAVRSPGSTLKPLIYGLAFEMGIAHPESLIEDRPTAFGGYVPGNFDRVFHGTVSVRRALQLSLNVPAVQLLEAVGPARLVARIRRSGAAPVLSDLSPPGLAIGLGGVGMTLRDLVQLYAAVARGGRPVRLVEQAGLGQGGVERPVLEQRAAWQVADVLAGLAAPGGIRGDDLAYKTGTSYGYRDAWAIGFDGYHVAGVWVGRPDGTPVSGLSGSEKAAPILRDIFRRLEYRQPLPAAPMGILQAANQQLPPPLRYAGVASNPGAAATPEPKIAFPPNGARVDLGDGVGAGRALVMKVRDGSPPFTWFANGAPVSGKPYRRTTTWTPDGAGFATIAVVDGRGRSSRVRVYIK